MPSGHARARLILLSCFDGSARPLTEKILARPRLLAQLQAAIGDVAIAHIAAYSVTGLERTLAVRLEVPLYGCDPDLQHLGSKGVLEDGELVGFVAGVVEDLFDEGDLAAGLAELKRRDPGLKRAVVKLNEGFSGDGNALFRFDDAPSGAGLAPWVRRQLRGMRFEARGMAWEEYLAKVGEMGAIVEAFIEGEEKRSPSAQYRVDPAGAIEAISTHDQVLGGPGGQVYQGCRFPADAAYRQEGRWRHYGIEINLRKGGTTHPFLMLQFLTGGLYDAASGLFLTPAGQARFYSASDNLEAPHYKGLTPADLIDVTVLNGLHYDGTAHEGVVFHLIGALSEFGKLGVVCVGASPERAEALYGRTVAVLDAEQMGG